MSRQARRILIGIAATVIVAVIVQWSAMGPSAALEVAAIAVGVGLVGMIVGAALLRLLRARPVGVQAAAVAVIASTTVAMCVVLAAQAMILDRTGIDTLIVIVVAGAAVGCILALWLGDQVGRAHADLLDATRRLGDAASLDLSELDSTPAETRQLAEELRRTAGRLEAARTEQRRLEEARIELVAWISHDIKTPLAGIRAIVEALEDGVIADPAEVEQAFSTLRTQSDALAALVDDLFVLSKSRAGLLAHKRVPVELDDLVSDTVSGLSGVAKRKGVSIIPETNQDAVTITAAPDELGRAIGNIVDNAIRFTPQCGEIRIALSTEDGSAVLAVMDSGPGIPQAALEQVFEAGYQQDPARSPGGGSGLGLAIARGIIEAHGGTVMASSSDLGATLTTRLPLADSEQISQAINPEAVGEIQKP